MDRLTTMYLAAETTADAIDAAYAVLGEEGFSVTVEPGEEWRITIIVDEKYAYNIPEIGRRLHITVFQSELALGYVDYNQVIVRTP